MKEKTFDVKKVIIYARHEFNWLPEMTPEEFELLINNIKEFGFDHRQPIIIYQGKILDGWQRYLAAMAIIAEFKTVGKNFDIMIPSYYDMTAELNDDLAIELVKRMMIRRNQPAETIIANFIKCSAMMKMIQQKVTDAANEKRSKKLQGNKHANKDKLSEENPPLPDPEKDKPSEENPPLPDPEKDKQTTPNSGETVSYGTKNDENTVTKDSAGEVAIEGEKVDKHKNELASVIAKELGGGDITRTKVENVLNLQKTDPEDFNKVVIGKTIKEVKKEKRSAAHSANPPQTKVKPKGKGHASDDLYVVCTTKDLWDKVRTARKQLRDEEAKLAPAHKAYAEDVANLLEIESQIQKNIYTIKFGLAEDLAEKIE